MINLPVKNQYPRAMLISTLVLALGILLPSIYHSAQSQAKQDNHAGLEKPEKQKKMQVVSVSYRKTGGFMATFKGCDLEASKLSPDERSKLQSLFESSRFPSLKSGTAPGAADVFYYWIKVHTSGKVYEVKYDDVTLPPHLRPLVEYLEANSKDLRPDQ